MNMRDLLPVKGAAIAVAAAFLASCGGGSGSDGPIAVTYTPATIEQSYTQHFDRTYVDSTSPQMVPVTVRFASAPPDDVVVVRVLTSEAVFTDSISFNPVNGSSTVYEAWLTPDTMIGPGVHEGDAKLQLCKDSSCSRVVSTEGQLHYKFTVKAGFKVTLKVNGVEITNPGGATAGTAGTIIPVDFPSGSTAEFTSTVPVTWDLNGLVFGNYSCNNDTWNWATVAKSNESATSLTLTINNIQKNSCDIGVRATPIDDPWHDAQYDMEISGV